MRCFTVPLVGISIHAPSRERHRLHGKRRAYKRYFNPRSLTGATTAAMAKDTALFISIHAPSRERPVTRWCKRGYNDISIHAPSRERPSPLIFCACANGISIHAPSRERLSLIYAPGLLLAFQSTLPHGSDFNKSRYNIMYNDISIHAPSRERRYLTANQRAAFEFQSTLPHGSDYIIGNDRRRAYMISIHAPSRERPKFLGVWPESVINFNPRSLTGATRYCSPLMFAPLYFNPRSLTGATLSSASLLTRFAFQSTLPHGSDLYGMFNLSM